MVCPLAAQFRAKINETFPAIRRRAGRRFSATPRMRNDAVTRCRAQLLSALLRDPARIDPAAKLEALAHRAYHAVRAIEREVAAKTIDGLESRAVRTDEIIKAKPAQLLRGPRER